MRQARARVVDVIRIQFPFLIIHYKSSQISSFPSLAYSRAETRTRSLPSKKHVC
jgi:hypothetical protein